MIRLKPVVSSSTAAAVDLDGCNDNPADSLGMFLAQLSRLHPQCKLAQLNQVAKPIQPNRAAVDDSK